MSSFVPEKVFVRAVLLHHFNIKKTSAESHRALVEVYGKHALAQRTCQKRLARFKSGDFVWKNVLGGKKRLKKKPNIGKAHRICGSHASSHSKTFNISRAKTH